ncbi:hypothetical protein NQF87_01815 [Bombella sp. TMW 2.2559]|uniref:Core-binding (CB) domain-containing protein n=1 Tax=Bombella dulcis TaxID=2967339 RepID=A0ABT3WDP1_9PROT|nr:DUF6538 domain-containing protein [Bombella dulcis]MCX5615718.1 hypothetical protein [Bombella dulcis]
MGKDSVPNFIIKRRNRYYFRLRVPADAIDPLGKEVVVSLQTTDKSLARDRMPNVLDTFRNCVKNANLIDQAEFINRLRDSVMGEVQPIPEYDGLRKSIQFLVLFSLPEFRNLWEANAKQARMLCKVRSMLNAGQPGASASPFTLKDPDAIARLVQEGDLRARQAFADHGYDFDDFPPTSSHEKPWQDYLEEFWKDNPGYAAKSITGMKTTFSYLERVWKKKPLNRINKGDLVDVANFLRDFVSERSNQPLSYKTIQRQLGEVKTFLRWAISKAYLHDDGFELVKPRKQTLDEKRSRDKRRSFTLEELKYFFNSSTFPDRETGPRWWLAIVLAMTGARGGEIIKAPI